MRIGRLGFFWIKISIKTKHWAKGFVSPFRTRASLDQIWPNAIDSPDLFPPAIADQLSLQNKVASFDGKLARGYIENLEGPLEQWFDDFDEQALASASIAQVHTATLKMVKMLSSRLFALIFCQLLKLILS